jgi:hypothetical protein
MAKRTAPNTVKCSSPVRRTLSGRFTGINGANPTSYKLDAGIDPPVRTGEGVWVVVLPGPIAGFKSARCTPNDTGEYHEVTHALSLANASYNNQPTITITHKTCSYATIVSAGPAAEDVVDEINFHIEVEESDCIGAGI